MEAKKSSKWKFWEKAIKEELTALENSDTWTVVEEPKCQEVISNRWVFRVKEVCAGKSVLVARGFEQTNFTNLSEIHAPVAKLSTLRILLTVCNNYDLFLEQLDVKNAFLNGSLNETIFMKIPQGLEVANSEKNKVYLLKKAIYGLKQAPKMWNEKFNDFMCSIKFKRSKSNYCLYTFIEQGICCYLLVYVDDILLACNTLDFHNYVKSKLCESFKMKTLTQVNSFLGIKFCRYFKNKVRSID